MKKKDKKNKRNKEIAFLIILFVLSLGIVALVYMMSWMLLGAIIALVTILAVITVAILWLKEDIKCLWNGYQLTGEIDSVKMEELTNKIKENKFAMSILVIMVAIAVFSVSFCAMRILRGEMVFDLPEIVNFILVSIISSLLLVLILKILDVAFETETRVGKLVVFMFVISLTLQFSWFFSTKTYNGDGSSQIYVFVNSKTGEVETIRRATNDVQHDPFSGRDYFIHPYLGDTCWKDDPKKFKPILPPVIRPDSVVILPVGTEYEITLLPGEVTKCWYSTASNARQCVVSSPDKNKGGYFVNMVGVGDVLIAGNTSLPDLTQAKFKIKAQEVPLTLTIKVF
jgi:hypothetical protein